MIVCAANRGGTAKETFVPGQADADYRLVRGLFIPIK